MSEWPPVCTTAVAPPLTTTSTRLGAYSSELSGLQLLDSQTTFAAADDREQLRARDDGPRVLRLIGIGEPRRTSGVVWQLADSIVALQSPPSALQGRAVELAELKLPRRGRTAPRVLLCPSPRLAYRRSMSMSSAMSAVVGEPPRAHVITLSQTRKGPAASNGSMGGSSLATLGACASPGRSSSAKGFTANGPSRDTQQSGAGMPSRAGERAGVAAEIDAPAPVLVKGLCPPCRDQPCVDADVEHVKRVLPKRHHARGRHRYRSLGTLRPPMDCGPVDLAGGSPFVSYVSTWIPSPTIRVTTNPPSTAATITRSANSSALVDSAPSSIAHRNRCPPRRTPPQARCPAAVTVVVLSVAQLRNRTDRAFTDDALATISAQPCAFDALPDTGPLTAAFAKLRPIFIDCGVSVVVERRRRARPRRLGRASGTPRRHCSAARGR